MVAISRKHMFVALSAGATLALGSSVAYAQMPGDEKGGHSRTLHLLDIAPTINTFVDNGTPGPSTGDSQVFRDTLVWADDRRPAGTSEGQCTLIEPATGDFTCDLVTKLDGGTLTTLGSATLVPGATSTAAVTGGTGVYENATGHATLTFNPGHDSVVAFTLRRP